MEGTYIIRKYSVIAGHRLKKHPLCSNVHGHNYVFELTLEPVKGRLNAHGFVIDFAEVDVAVKPLLSEMDHAFFIDSADLLMHKALVELNSKYFVVNGPPSAEHLAQEFFYRAKRLLPDNVILSQVTCYETVDCWATFCPPTMRPANG